MNDKHASILLFLERASAWIQENAFDIVDYWDADLCAIGLRKKDKLFYISTNYSVIHKNLNTLLYDYDVEQIDENDSEKYTVIKEVRQVSEEEIIQEINLFINRCNNHCYLYI